MTNSKHTKSALLTSILSMALCVAMLVGSTFAWFTDSVTSGNNKIQAGNLKVTLEWASGTEGLDTANWQDASTGAIFNYDLWEPGYTETRHVRISNKGNLALKYEIRIVANGEVSKLADVIDVYYIKGGQQLTGRTDLTDENKIGTLKEILAKPYVAKGHILAGENAADVATIALKMQESAGNEYQGLSIGTDFSVQLVAAQYTQEEDSFDDQYDADAGYPVSATVSDKESLDAALNNPGVPVEITLGGSIDHKEYDGLIVTGNATMNMGGNSVLRNGMGQLVSVKDGGNLTLNATTPETDSYPTKETAGRLMTDGEGTELAVNGGYYTVSGGQENQGVVAAVNGSVVKLTSGIYKDNHSRGAVVSANTGAQVTVSGGEFIANGYQSSIFYADGGVIEITDKVTLTRRGANSVEFTAVNGGKVVISKTAVTDKPVSIGAGCVVNEEGNNWVITQP